MKDISQKQQRHQEFLKEQLKKKKVLPKLILVAGFMQFVQSVPVAEVLATEGNIQVSRSNQDTADMEF